ncbi:glutathione S-transferase family protein [Acetobacter sacchari]|uniref:Glutathione S-transferase family protein n=1 Tax=Acetobacter sacchari TaxID=2661687 RepID=A0ABS3LT09_9PROT|nr:glutathione S-transferase family protein [Acetobacter sacchari]MBO1359045.1 glutathione S-transferase family protein [Acetobacter sacchari]
MADGRLVIGTKRYSSWSMRGWLSVHLAGLDVVEELVALAQPDTAERLTALSPSARAPYLEHLGVSVWDSLAIAEYCADIEPSLWPVDPVKRGFARSISAEMHSGFQALRVAMPMNLGRGGRGLANGVPDAVSADIARIDALWTEARDRFGGGGHYLFGAEFGNADVAFAPVVARFLSYGVPLSTTAQRYAEAVRAHPLVARWYAEAEAEPTEWLAERYESAD